MVNVRSHPIIATATRDFHYCTTCYCNEPYQMLTSNEVASLNCIDLVTYSKAGTDCLVPLVMDIREIKAACMNSSEFRAGRRSSRHCYSWWSGIIKLHYLGYQTDVPNECHKGGVITDSSECLECFSDPAMMREPFELAVRNSGLSNKACYFLQASCYIIGSYLTSANIYHHILPLSQNFHLALSSTDLVKTFPRGGFHRQGFFVCSVETCFSL